MRLRTAAVFLVMVAALGAGTPDAPRGGHRAGHRRPGRGYAGDNGTAIDAWLDTPGGGVVVAPTGDILFADSNNHVVRRIDPAQQNISTIVGNYAAGAGFSGRLRTPPRRHSSTRLMV